MTSYLSAVVSPVEQGLSLSRPTIDIAFATVSANLGYVSAHRFPSLNLALVIGASSAHIIPAVPLEPTPWVLVINPSLLPPVRQRL